MLSSGGFYESSILLFDKFWTRTNLDVIGETVVAVPSREVLIVTGSQFPQGLEIMRSMVATAYNDGATAISKSLFVLRGGRFDVFEKA